MKRIPLLFSSLLLGVIAYSQAPVKKSAKPHAAGAKLLIKCNTDATLIINGLRTGIVEANKPAAFSILPGSKTISIMPVDPAKYNEFDTTIIVSSANQAVLSTNLSPALPVAEIMDKVAKATSLADISTKVSALFIKLQEADSAIDQDIYLFPDKAHFLHIPGPSGTDNTSETRINKNTFYRHDKTGPAKDDPWVAVTAKQGRENILYYIYKDIFGQGGDIFIRYPEYRVVNTGTETIGSKSVIKIQLEKKDSHPIGTNEGNAVYDYSIYIDKDNYLPLKLIYSTQWVNIKTNQLSRNRVEYNYTDYGSFGTFLLPASNGSTLITQFMTSIYFEDKNALFAVPESISWY